MASPCWYSKKALGYLLLATLPAWAVKSPAMATPAGDLPSCPASLSGAISVTYENGNPASQNNFSAKTEAYLISGAACGSGGQSGNLPAGTYMFQVTAADGALLSSDPVTNREFTVDTLGRIVSTNDGHPWNTAVCAGAGLAIQLAPFNTSPSGDYLVWVTPKSCYDCNSGASLNGFFADRSKTSGFNVTRQAAVADIKIEKLVNGQKLVEALPGDLVTFTLRISNVGSVDAANVRVEDLLPAGLVYVDGSSSSADAVMINSTPRLQWKIPTLLVGCAVQISFRAKLDPAFAQASCGLDLVNEATANAQNASAAGRSEGCPAAVGSSECVYVGDIATVRIRCLPPPKLTLSKASVVENQPLKGGSWIRYTLILKNEGGSDALDVSVIDRISTLTHNITIVSATGDKGDNGSWYWTAEVLTVVFKQVKAGETCTLVFKVQVKSDAACDGIVANSAKAVSGNLEVASNATSDKLDCAAPKLTLTKKSQVLNAPLRGDSRVLYTLALKNEGGADAANVNVIDTFSGLTQGITGVAAGGDKGSAGSWTWTAEALTVTFNQVKAGETCTITFQVQVKNSAKCDDLVVNRAKAVFGGTEVASNETSDKVECLGPKLEIAKAGAVLNGLLQAGSTIQYTLTVKNAGDQAAAKVLVVDALDALTVLDTQSVSVSCGGNCASDLAGSSSAQLKVLLAEIKSGETCTISFKVQVAQQAACASRIVNKAQLQYESQSFWSNEVSFKVSCPPDLCSSTKTVTDLNGGKLQPGDLLEYRISLINNGETDATAVRLTDELSAFLESTVAVIQIPAGAADHSAGGSLDIRNIQVPGKGTATVMFRVRVRAGAKGGSRISNMAVIHPALEGGKVCTVRSRDLVVAYCSGCYEVVGRIDLGGDPVMGAVNPVTHEAVVTSGLLNRVVIVDLAEQKVLGYVPVESPYGVTVNPETNEAIVTNLWSDTITVVDLNQKVVVAVIPVGSIPKGVAVNPRTNQAVVANSGSGSVSIVDLTRRIVVASVKVGYGPDSVTINPVTNKAVVSNNRSGSVSLLDLASGKLEANIPAGMFPLGVAFNINTNLVYAANQGDGTLSNIYPVARQLLGQIPVGDRSSMPEQVDVDENTNQAAVSVFNDHALVFVNLTSGEILARVDLRPFGGRGPRGVAMDRELGIVLVVHQQSNIVVLVSM